MFPESDTDTLAKANFLRDAPRYQDSLIPIKQPDGRMAPFSIPICALTRQSRALVFMSSWPLPAAQIVQMSVILATICYNFHNA